MIYRPVSGFELSRVIVRGLWFGLVMLVSCNQGDDSSSRTDSLPPQDIVSGELCALEEDAVSQSATVFAAPRDAIRDSLAGRQESLDEMRQKWAEIRESKWIGRELDAAKKEWAKKALAEIGGSREFSELLDFLDQQGESDLRKWMLEDGLAEAARGERAAELRIWLRSLGPEQEKLAEQAGLAIGKGFLGDEEGLRSYLAAFSNDHIQSSILTGFTLAYTAEHPEEVVSKFMSLRPPGVLASGLTDVMAALPSDTDFIAAGSGMPDDGKTLAKRARAAMLENWAGTDPQAAAQYVMSNTSKVHADQLGVVMEEWYASDAAGAEAWSAHVASVEHLDAVRAAEARAFAKTDLARAWEAVGQVADFDRKIEAAKPVYEVWAGRDPQGAAQAWEVMFNAE